MAVSIHSGEDTYVGGHHMHSKYKLQFLFHNGSKTTLSKSIIQKKYQAHLKVYNNQIVKRALFILNLLGSNECKLSKNLK